jgi:RNA binding exosome subunit
MVRATVNSVNLSRNKWWSIEKKEWTYSNPQDQEMTEITNNFLSTMEKEVNKKEVKGYLGNLNSLLSIYLKKQ